MEGYIKRERERDGGIYKEKERWIKKKRWLQRGKERWRHRARH